MRQATSKFCEPHVREKHPQRCKISQKDSVQYEAKADLDLLCWSLLLSHYLVFSREGVLYQPMASEHDSLKQKNSVLQWRLSPKSNTINIPGTYILTLKPYNVNDATMSGAGDVSYECLRP